MAKKVIKKTPKKKAASRNTARKAKKASLGRAPGKTQISISLSEDLVTRIDLMAAAENRNRSNFIANELEKIGE